MVCLHLLSASWITRIWFGGIVRTKNTKEEKVDKDVTGWIPSRLQAKEKRRGHFNI
jgi:hypothetical protein